MDSIVFDFTLRTASLFPILGLILFIFVFIRLLRMEPRPPSYNWFITYLGVEIFAGIFDFLAVSSTNPHDTLTFYLLFQIGNIFSFAPLMGFVFSYTERTKFIDTFYKKAALFIPPLFLTTLIVFTNGVTSHSTEHLFLSGLIWQVWNIPYGPLYDTVYVGLIQVAVISSIILFIIHGRRVSDPVRKKQSFIFAGALIAAMIFDTSVFVILPKIVGKPIIPDGMVAVAIMGIVFALNLMQKKLFTTNPTAYVENIVASMSEVVIVLNTDFYIEAVKGPIRVIFGYTPRDMNGQPLSKFIQGEWNTFLTKTIQTIDPNHPLGQEYELITRSGEHLPVKISATTYKGSDGTIQGYVLVVTDLSPIKELLHAEAERNKLSVITESITDLIVAVDFNQNIVMANSAFRRFITNSETKLIGNKLSSFVKIYADNKDLSTESLLQKGEVLNDTILAQYRNVALTIEGKTIMANITSSAIKEGSKVNVAAIIVIQDLTEEQELEKMKLDFVSMAAHELRTPLTAIRGYAEALRQEIANVLSEEQITYLNRIDSATLQLTGLMENLLSASRIEKGTYNLNLSTTDWVALVNGAIKNHTLQAKEANVNIHFNIPSTAIPSVKVDSLRITEVINNLVSNAIKYSPGGSVFVSIHYDDKGKQVVTDIKDTGQGIPKEALHHMFEKFFRVWGTLEMGSKGTGLGLYLSRAIIELHGGKIWVESDGPNKGSTFSFSLPIDKKTPA